LLIFSLPIFVFVLLPFFFIMKPQEKSVWQILN